VSARARRLARANGNAVGQLRGWHAADRHQPWRFQTYFIVLEHARTPTARQIAMLECQPHLGRVRALGRGDGVFCGSEGDGQWLISEGSTSGLEHFAVDACISASARRF
jgi:hypothetical protein